MEKPSMWLTRAPLTLCEAHIYLNAVELYLLAELKIHPAFNKLPTGGH